MCCRHPFACLWKAEWVRPRKPVKKKIFRAQVQRWPFVHNGRCKMEKQIPGLHNWAAIWMTFPLLLCALTMAIQDLGGSTCRSTNSFFSFLPHSTHGRASPSLAATQKWLEHLKNNLVPKVKVTAFSPSQRCFLSLTNPCVLLCVNIMWLKQLRVATAQPHRWHMPCATLSLYVGQQCGGGSADEPRGHAEAMST